MAGKGPFVVEDWAPWKIWGGHLPTPDPPEWHLWSGNYLFKNNNPPSPQRKGRNLFF